MSIQVFDVIVSVVFAVSICWRSVRLRRLCKTYKEVCDVENFEEVAKAGKRINWEEFYILLDIIIWIIYIFVVLNSAVLT